MARLWCRKSPEGREFEVGLRHLTTGNLSASTKWELFSNQGRQRKERDGLRISFAVPKIQ